MPDHDKTTRYPDMRVRRMHGMAGVRIAGTEYAMSLSDLMRLSSMLDVEIDRLARGDESNV